MGDLIGPQGLCGINKLVEIGLPAGKLDRQGLNLTLYDNVTNGIIRTQVGNRSTIPSPSLGLRGGISDVWT